MDKEICKGLFLLAIMPELLHKRAKHRWYFQCSLSSIKFSFETALMGDKNAQYCFPKSSVLNSKTVVKHFHSGIKMPELNRL